MREYLHFEAPLEKIQTLIDEHQSEAGKASPLHLEKIEKLKQKYQATEEKIFKRLSAYDVLALARHPDRPHTNDFIAHIVSDFRPVHGNRLGQDCPTTLTGIGYLVDRPVMFIGQVKGRELNDRIRCNFGMMSPMGYQKAKRAMLLAEKFKLPIITLIDTPGAYPGIKAEEENQSGCIAENLKLMSQLKTPIINCIIGEGCSGGALGIGVGDVTLMLEYASYSVISPEGCASILWKSADMKGLAATEMKLTAANLLKNKLIDSMIPEGPGAAHQHPKRVYQAVKNTLIDELDKLTQQALPQLLEKRFERLMLHGLFNA